MRLLLVDDDDAFAAALAAGLALDGHAVQRCATRAAADAAFAAGGFDAALLDLGLPDGDGTALLHALRRRDDTTPVIVVSARGQLDDRLALLDAGADDYLVKPLDLDELGARLRALWRRRGVAASAPLVHGALALDLAARRCVWHGQAVELREREFALLALFVREPARVFTRAALEAALYGGRAPDSNAVEVHLHHLRRKLARDVVVTLRGQGYRLGPAA